MQTSVGDMRVPIHALLDHVVDARDQYGSTARLRASGPIQDWQERILLDPRMPGRVSQIDNDIAHRS